jgi:branched-chain amino acid transport system permease protein
MISLLLEYLSYGSICALATCGVVLVFRASFTANYAQAYMSILGCFSTAWFFDKINLSIGMANAKQTGLNFFVGLFANERQAGARTIYSVKQLLLVIVSALVGIIAAFLVGVLIDRLVIANARSTDPLTRQILTLGLILVFLGLVPIVFMKADGQYFKPFKPFINGSFNVGDDVVSYQLILVIVISLVFIALLFFLLMKTKFGLSVRATASNDTVAKMMGIKTPVVTMVSWAIAAALGSAAGLFLSSTKNADFDPSLLGGVQVVAFLACIFGGLQTFYGPIIASYIITLSIGMFTYIGGPSGLDLGLGSWSTPIIYVLLIVFMAVKPYGLFGKRIVKKV